jgi:2-polyprenyl-6-methoxyphenol hydroxylase-like FAD-dependent oxidoreductase
MEERRTTVLVAGGSVAGLATANFLEKAGVDYLLLEKYTEIGPNLGASIAIFPNGARILDQLGCWEPIVKILGDCHSFQRLQGRNIRGKLSLDLTTLSESMEDR